METTILVDSREQRPWHFETPTENATLKTGDYSLRGFEERIAIERKSLNDLVGSLSRGRDRFEAELERAASFEQFVIVVEASISDVIGHKYQSQMAPAAITGSIIALWSRYGTPFLFADTPKIAGAMAEKILLRFQAEHTPIQVLRQNPDYFTPEFALQNCSNVGADVVRFDRIKTRLVTAWLDFWKELDYKAQNFRYGLAAWGDPDRQVREEVGKFCEAQGCEFIIARDEDSAYKKVERFFRKHTKVVA